MTWDGYNRRTPRPYWLVEAQMWISRRRWLIAIVAFFAILGYFIFGYRTDFPTFGPYDL